jgi:hypothetical protein
MLACGDLKISGRAGNTSARHGYKSIRAENERESPQIQVPRLNLKNDI